MKMKRDMIFMVVVSLLIAHLCFFAAPNVIEPWNAQIIDKLFLIRTSLKQFRPTYDSSVVHLDISNTAIQHLGTFYLNRAQYARGINNLNTMKTAVQALDFIFAARMDEKADAELMDATRKAQNVYMGLAFSLSEKQRDPRKGTIGKDDQKYLDGAKWQVRTEGDTSEFYVGDQPLMTFAALSSCTRGIGFLSVKPDRDSIYRRTPLLVRYGGDFFPSFSFRIVCDYLGVKPEKIVVKPGSSITLTGARRPGGKAHDMVIPIDSKGNMVINFVGSWESMKHYNFADVYRASEDRDEMESWKEELSGKIVLISDVSTGSNDIGSVPTDPNFPLSGIHANVINTILTEQFLKELTNQQQMLIEISLLALVLLLSFKLSSIRFLFGTSTLALIYCGAVAAFFLYAHTIFPVVRPLLFIALASVLTVSYQFFIEEKEKAVYRRTIEAYFPPSLVKKLVANPQMLTLAGQKKELTILFSDIKSFTTYSAGLTPDQIQRSLNEYFEAMIDIVFKHQGTVDKYIGDGLMVFFGDPEPQSDHALRCVRAAVEMQQRVKELKDKWEGEQRIPIRIRIGINTGEVVVGNMGSARRLSYTVLGSAVNLAQRLESNAPVGGIMISKRTFDLVKEHVPTCSLGQIRVKGIENPIEAYEVLVDGESACERTQSLSAKN